MAMMRSGMAIKRGLPSNGSLVRGWKILVGNPLKLLHNILAIGFSDESGEYKELGSVTPDQIFQKIQDTLNQGRYVVTGTVRDAEKRSEKVLIGGHAYSIHNAYVANGQKMILLRNPWGKDNSENAQAPEDPSSNTQDGFVAIAFDRFLENFDGVSLSKP